MMHRWSVPLVLLIVVSALGINPGRPSAWAHPDPAIVSSSWSLAFQFQHPTAIAVPDARGVVRWYWYATYEVVNETGEDRMFIPEITIADDQGRIATAGQNVPPAVFKAIKARLQNPLLKSPIEVVGKLLQGEDYAKGSVIIWPASDKDVDEFTVFISGLSGETATIPHPLTGQDVLMRRTLMLTFATPGNLPNPQDQPVVLEKRREVMR